MLGFYRDGSRYRGSQLVPVGRIVEFGREILVAAGGDPDLIECEVRRDDLQEVASIADIGSVSWWDRPVG